MNITKHTLNPENQLPPALVEAIHDDPAEYAPAARVMAITMIHEEYVSRGDLTHAQRMDLLDRLMRAGKLDGKSQDVGGGGGGGGYQLVINFSGATKEQFSGVTIEQQAERVVEQIEAPAVAASDAHEDGS